MELVTYSHGDRDLRVGLVAGGRVLDVAAAPGWRGDPPRDLLDLLGRGPAGRRVLEGITPAAVASADLADVKLAAPVVRPGKILAVAQNFTDHLSEAGLEAPAKTARRPLVFCKLPSTLIGP